MLYWIAQQLGISRHPQPVPLPDGPDGRRDHDRFADRAHHRPEVHRLAARAPGQGPADPERRAADPPRKARHPDDGRADDPDRARILGLDLDGPVQPVRLGGAVRDARLRRDRVPRRLRQGAQRQRRGHLRPDPPAARVRDRRRGGVDHHDRERDPSVSAVHQPHVSGARLVLPGVRRLPPSSRSAMR